MEKIFLLFIYYVFTYLLMPYNMMIFQFHLPYFHVWNSAVFLHSTLVFPFYIDVVLTLSIKRVWKWTCPQYIKFTSFLDCSLLMVSYSRVIGIPYVCMKINTFGFRFKCSRSGFRIIIFLTCYATAWLWKPSWHHNFNTRSAAVISGYMGIDLEKPNVPYDKWRNNRQI